MKDWFTHNFDHTSIPTPQFNFGESCNVHNILHGELQKAHTVCVIVGARFVERGAGRKGWEYYVRVWGRNYYQWLREENLSAQK